MKRALLLLLATPFLFTFGCAGCGGNGELLDHAPTKAELRVALENAYFNVNKNVELKDAMVNRLIGPKLPWASLSKIERERHMSRTVMPVMLTFFRSFDKNSSDSDFDQNRENRFRKGFGQGISGTFNCFTCHGESFPKGNLEDFDFARPTHLYPLDPRNLPTEENPGKSSARMIRFMKYTVTPAFRILLGRDDVSCFSCHQKKE